MYKSLGKYRKRVHYFQCTLLLLAGLMLLAGGMLYLLFRPRTLVMFRVADWLGWSAVITDMRAVAAAGTLPEWVVYWLPNALWTTSYILMTEALSAGSHPRQKLLKAGLIPALGMVSELLQGWGVIRGTFDWWDLAAYLVPYLIYSLYIQLKR